MGSLAFSYKLYWLCVQLSALVIGDFCVNFFFLVAQCSVLSLIETICAHCSVFSLMIICAHCSVLCSRSSLMIVRALFCVLIDYCARTVLCSHRVLINDYARTVLCSHWWLCAHCSVFFWWSHACTVLHSRWSLSMCTVHCSHWLSTCTVLCI